jgi:hypothetical protein
VLVPHLARAECRPVAGTIDAAIIGGEPTSVLGTVTGTLAGATRAVVTGQSQEDDGTIGLDLAHDFVTLAGGSLRTVDSAVWTPIPGHDGLFHMATEYSIEGGTGTWAGATGSLRNAGIADTATGLLTLRYEGEICRN